MLPPKHVHVSSLDLADGSLILHHPCFSAALGFGQRTSFPLFSLMYTRLRLLEILSLLVKSAHPLVVGGEEKWQDSYIHIGIVYYYMCACW